MIYNAALFDAPRAKGDHEGILGEGVWGVLAMPSVRPKDLPIAPTGLHQSEVRLQQLLHASRRDVLSDLPSLDEGAA